MRTRLSSTVSGIAAAAILQLGCPAFAEIITIVEFYNTDLKHYVLITDPAEVAAIEQGAAGPGWERTGGSLMAYSTPTDVQGLFPVCRFYGNVAAGGPNSHFFTADPAECAAVKLDPGWRYEGIAFYVKLVAASPAVSRKATTTDRPVYRAYNNGFRPQQGINDGNHRFSTSRTAITDLAAQGWADEGTVFVVPGSTDPGAGLSGNCLIPKPGFEGTYGPIGSPGIQRVETFGMPAAPTVQVTTQLSGITALSRTTYGLSAQQNGRQLMTWDLTHNEVTGPGVLIVEDISMPQALQLPMRPQEIQVNQGALVGSHATTTPAGTCSSAINGSYVTSYQFLGLQTVTVPSGTFGACAFLYRQTVNMSLTCPIGGARGQGWGGAGDSTILWFSETIGLIGSSSGDPQIPGTELDNIIRLP